MTTIMFTSPLSVSTSINDVYLPAISTIQHADDVGSGGGGGGRDYDTLNASTNFEDMAANLSTRTTMLGVGMGVGPTDNTNYDIILSNELVQIIFCLLYSSIFILGVFGNVLVCYVVFRNKAMQTVTNLFITNLALSDILLCILAVPFTPSYTFIGRWVFGKLLCHTVAFAQGCSVYISTLTLTSIAIDRFFVIIYPFHPRMKLSTCITIILLIWTFALLATLPYGLYMKLDVSDVNETIPPLSILNDSINVTLSTKDSYYYCEEEWPSEQIRHIFSSVTSILQFVLPFLIMAFCYVSVSIKLNDRARSKPGSKTSRREEADRDRKKRTNRMLISMVAIFGISWLPLNVVNVCNDFYSGSNDWRFYNLIFFVAHLTAMSSTCYNPFLYAWLNENFRKEFKQVLPCFDPSRGRNGVSSGGRNWRSERTCNGNNETVQETLLPCTSQLQRTPQTATKPTNPKTQQTVDSILLSEVGPTPILSNPIPSIQSQETVILPSGVLETPFEETIIPASSAAQQLMRNNNNNNSNQKTPIVGNGGFAGKKAELNFSSLILINDGSCDQKMPEII